MSVARFARRVRILARGLHAFSTMGAARGVGQVVVFNPRRAFRASYRAIHRLHHRASPSTCCGSSKKNSDDQALGRSRGGLTTKIHAAGIDENRSAALHISSGNSGDAPAFDVLYDGLNSENVVEAIAMDKAYDSDHIRGKLEADGIEPVVPPRANRLKKYPYDPEIYARRNTIERFFNKLKQFRRIATRYDKLRLVFVSAVQIVAAFICLKNS